MLCIEFAFMMYIIASKPSQRAYIKQKWLLSNIIIAIMMQIDIAHNNNDSVNRPYCLPLVIHDSTLFNR